MCHLLQGSSLGHGRTFVDFELLVSKSNPTNPYLLVPIRAVAEVVSVVHKDLLAGLDVMCGSHAGDEAKARVVKDIELGVGHERVVGLVGQAGHVILLIPEINI